MNAALTAIGSHSPQPTLLDEENRVITQAMEILDKRLFKNAQAFTNQLDVEHFLKLQFVEKQHEVFAVIFLNNRHQIISFDKMFNGSINSCTIHPREVVKRALSHNAAAAILCHNHPSGCTAPSNDDLKITEALQAALKMVDVKILDHFIVGQGKSYSFAAHGLM